MNGFPLTVADVLTKKLFKARSLLLVHKDKSMSSNGAYRRKYGCSQIAKVQ
jgi:hypothetical protein